MMFFLRIRTFLHHSCGSIITMGHIDTLFELTFYPLMRPVIRSLTASDWL